MSEALDELLSVKRWNAIVRNIDEEIEMIYDTFGIRSPSLNSNGGHSSASRDVRLAEAVTRIEELQEQKKNCIAMVKYISNQINSLDDYMSVRILHMRFIQGKKWEDIAEETGYTMKAVFLKYKKAKKDYIELHNNHNV